MSIKSLGPDLATVAKRIINRGLGYLKLEVRRTRRAPPRSTLRGAMNQACQRGLKPATVIDVGAADGTLELYEIFPHARHVLIEPLIEFKPRLDELRGEFAQLEYTIAAASSKAGETVLHVHRDLYGSSLHLEHEDSNNGLERTVSAIRVDDLCAELPPPYLLKVDVQGGELDVLAGSERTLLSTDCVVLETTLIEFFDQGPLFRDVMECMHGHGFALYDLVDIQYRPLDDAVSQVDAVFVPQRSQLRRDRVYATSDQRARLNRQFEEHLTTISRVGANDKVEL